MFKMFKVFKVEHVDRFNDKLRCIRYIDSNLDLDFNIKDMILFLSNHDEKSIMCEIYDYFKSNTLGEIEMKVLEWLYKRGI